MHARNLVTLLALFVLAVSCGGSSSGGGSNAKNKQRSNPNSSTDSIQNETVKEDGSNVQGIYATPLWSINYNLHVPVAGHAMVSRNGDEFRAKLKLNVGPRDTQVRQGIFYGRRCPELKDDLNNDAFIDGNEAKLAIGLMTIPLDGDLNGQADGLYNFPAGRSNNGSYLYEESASFDRMFQDLKQPEMDFTDDIMKIMPQDGITFPGRVLLVMGLEEGIVLPPTVQGAYGMTAHQAMPIACGILWKVEEMPEQLQ